MLINPSRESSSWVAISPQSTLPFPTSEEVAGNTAVELTRLDSIGIDIINLRSVSTCSEAEDLLRNIWPYGEGKDNFEPDPRQDILPDANHFVMPDYHTVNGSDDRANVIKAIELENSKARQKNSTFDISVDSNTPLNPIKRQDGSVGEGFPTDLYELFFYRDVDFIKLLEEYDITPHEEFELNCEEVLRLIGLVPTFTIGSFDSNSEDMSDVENPFIILEDEVKDDAWFDDREVCSSPSNISDSLNISDSPLG